MDSVLPNNSLTIKDMKRYCEFFFFISLVCVTYSNFLSLKMADLQPCDINWFPWEQTRTNRFCLQHNHKNWGWGRGRLLTGYTAIKSIKLSTILENQARWKPTHHMINGENNIFCLGNATACPQRWLCNFFSDFDSLTSISVLTVLLGFIYF